MSSDAWTDLLARTVFIGNPQFVIRRDLLDDPTTLITILHEYSHYLALSSTLGNTFTCFIMNCYCLQTVLQKLDLGATGENNAQELLDLLQALVDSQLRLKALFYLWAPFLEGFAIFSEHDTPHINDLVTDEGNLVAELHVWGRKVIKSISDEMSRARRTGAQFDYDRIRETIFVAEFERLHGYIVNAQRKAVEEKDIIIMTDTCQKRDSAYLAGYFYIRYLKNLLSKKDSRLSDPNFFWFFLIRLLRSKFGKFNTDLLFLPFEEFLTYIGAELFDRIVKLESVPDDRVKTICDELEDLKTMAPPVLFSYDAWDFIKDGSRLPLPDAVQEQADYCAEITASILARLDSTAKKYLVMYKSVLKEVRDFLFPTTLQGYSYENCTLDVGRDPTTSLVLLSIKLQESGLLLSLILPYDKADKLFEFLQHAKSKAFQGLRLLQLIRYTPWASHGQPRFRTLFALQCDDKFYVFPGQVHPDLGLEELEELEKRLSKQFYEQIIRVQDSATFEARKVKDLLSKLLSKARSNLTVREINEFQDKVNSHLKKLDIFRDSVLKKTVYRATGITDIHILDDFLQRGVLIVCSKEEDRKVLEFLMKRGSGASAYDISNALSIAETEAQSAIDRMNSKSQNLISYKIIERIGDKWCYVRPGG